MKLHTGVSDTYVQPEGVTTAEGVLMYLATLAESGRAAIQMCRNGKPVPSLFGGEAPAPTTEEACAALSKAVAAMEKHLPALKDVLAEHSIK